MRLILMLLLATLISFGCSKTKSVFILQKNFTGTILVIYNQTDDPVIQLKSNTYNVPKDGILKIRDANNPNWEELPEFYYESINQSQKISFELDMNNLPSDEVVVCGGSLVKAYSNDNPKNYIEYRIYYVGNDSEISDFYKRAQSLNFEKLSNL